MTASTTNLILCSCIINILAPKLSNLISRLDKILFTIRLNQLRHRFARHALAIRSLGVASRRSWASRADPRNNSGSLAIFAAIRGASSRVSSF